MQRVFSWKRSAPLTERMGTGGPLSVSYTHLDVYKRQYLTFMIRTERRREVGPIVGANERRRAILEVLCQRKPVSYTHLDVYKRQEIFF